MLLRLFFLLNIIFSLVSCSTKESNQSYYLNSTNEYIKFSLDSTIRTFSRLGLTHEQDGKIFYYFLIPGQNTILEFEIENSSTSRKLMYDFNGPEGFGEITGFKVIQRDSLIIINNAKELFIANAKGKILSKIDYNLTDNKIETTPGKVLSSVYQEIEVEDDSLLLLSQLPGENWRNYSNEDFNNQRIVLGIKPKNNSIKLLPLTYPKDYMISGFLGVYFSRTFDEKKYIYSFEGDHNLYVTVDHKKFQKIVNVGSDLIPQIKPLESETFDEYLAHGITNPRYLSILYDKYRDVYYRFVYLGNEVENADDLQEKLKYLSNLSVIVLDSNLKKLYELRLEKNKYFRNLHFISPDGLFISVNNPYGSHHSEDSLVFEKFNFTSKDN